LTLFWGWYGTPEVGSFVETTLKTRSYTLSQSSGIYTLEDKLFDFFFLEGIIGGFFFFSGLYIFFGYDK